MVLGLALPADVFVSAGVISTGEALIPLPANLTERVMSPLASFAARSNWTSGLRTAK